MSRQRVYCHRTKDVIRHTAFSLELLSQFDRRALLCADANDIVVVEEPQGSVQDEVLLLNRLGIGPTPVANVRNSLTGLEGREIDPFSGTSVSLHRDAAGVSCRLRCPVREFSLMVNSKVFFQKAFGNDPDNCLPYGIVCQTRDDVPAAVARIREKGGVPRIKAADSASGLYQWVLQPGDPILDLPPDSYVVQTDIGGDALVDASVQFSIDQNGRVAIGPVTRQHVKDHKTHCGNWRPAGVGLDGAPELPIRLRLKMREITRRIVVRLKDIGYFGRGSVDFLCDLFKSLVWALEVNARWTAASYALEALQTWYGGKSARFAFDMRSFAVPTGATIHDLEGHFRDLLFRRGEGWGFVPFCFLPKVETAPGRGFSYGVAIAPTTTKLLDLVSRVEERKLRLS
ncbi:hypothetical protein HY734_03515 [Candidatus Uhrbacteria bacterium]|nr:hypothetical protein [Candidatus Uhrbacteria bacterium]